VNKYYFFIAEVDVYLEIDFLATIYIIYPYTTISNCLFGVHMYFLLYLAGVIYGYGEFYIMNLQAY